MTDDVVTLQTNYNNDLYVDDTHSLVLLSGVDAIAAVCRSAMQVWKSECVLNQTKGLPFDETVFTRYQPAQFEAAGRKVLLAIDGVNSVESFTVNLSKHTMSYTASIATDYGSTTLNG